MKYYYLLCLLMLLMNCKNEENTQNTQKNTVNNSIEIETLKGYPVKAYKKINLYTIHEETFVFSNELVIDKIQLYEQDDLNFQVLIYINSATNIEKLKSLFVDAAFYPVNFEELELESDRKAQKKRVQTVGTNLFNYNNNLVLVVNSFSMKPLDFSKAIVLFYNAEGTIINDASLIVKPFRII